MFQNLLPCHYKIVHSLFAGLWFSSLQVFFSWGNLKKKLEENGHPVQQSREKLEVDEGHIDNDTA